MKLNEDELMIAYQKGNDAALEKIYILLKKPIYSFIFRYTRDEQLSIDIVQDTFVKLQRYKKNYNPNKGNLKSYLFQTAYRLMVTKLNRRKKWRQFLPYLVPTKNESLPSADRMTVQDAISNLPEKQRAVVLLFYYHDMTQDQVAEVLNIPVGTVKSRLSASIDRLRKDWEGINNDSRPF